jgi:hypothetical protein
MKASTSHVRLHHKPTSQSRLVGREGPTRDIQTHRVAAPPRARQRVVLSRLLPSHIRKVPAGTTITSGQSLQSLKLSCDCDPTIMADAFMGAF